MLRFETHKCEKKNIKSTKILTIFGRFFFILAIKNDAKITLRKSWSTTAANKPSNFVVPTVTKQRIVEAGIVSHQFHTSLFPILQQRETDYNNDIGMSTSTYTLIFVNKDKIVPSVLVAKGYLKSQVPRRWLHTYRTVAFFRFNFPKLGNA